MMQVQFDLKDFDSLWNTGCEIKHKATWFPESFPLWRLEPMRGRKTLKGLTWFYWTGESELQALVAYKILKGANYKAGLFWDCAQINEKPESPPWGFVIATNYTRESKNV